jgi:hypothetical protein
VWSLMIMLMLMKITLNNRPVKSISGGEYTYYLITNLDSLHLTLSPHTSRPLTKPRHKKTLLQSLKSWIVPSLWFLLVTQATFKCVIRQLINWSRSLSLNQKKYTMTRIRWNTRLAGLLLVIGEFFLQNRPLMLTTNFTRSTET